MAECGALSCSSADTGLRHVRAFGTEQIDTHPTVNDTLNPALAATSIEMPAVDDPPGTPSHPQLSLWGFTS